MNQEELNLFEAQYEIATKSLAANDHQKALSNVTKLLEINPDYLPAYHLRGKIYVRMKEHSKAMADFELVLEKLENPVIDLLFDKAMLHSELKEFEKAILNFSEIIDLLGEHSNDVLRPFVYLQRGYVHFETGDFEKAIKDLDKCLEIDPNHKFALFIRGSIHLYDLENDQLAIDDFTRVLALDPSKFEAYLERGNAYRFLGKQEKACLDYQKAYENGIEEALDMITKFCR